jgi:hypothetical protein
MEEKSTFIEPYKASGLHKIYAWVDRLPGPYWLFSVLILVVTGALNNIVAWNAKTLPFGQINWYYATVGLFFSYYFFANDFLLRVAKNAVTEFLTILDADENKKHRILFEFTHLPASPTAAIFVIGAALGFYQGIQLLPTAPEMNRAFPVMEVAMYALPIGITFVAFYLLFRSPRLIVRLFEEKAKFDIFDQTSIYAISRYSAWTIIITAIPTYLTFLLLPSWVETQANLSIIVFGWLIALIVFWLPLRRVNRKLVAEKQRLLKDVNLRIRANFDLLHAKMDRHEYQNIAEIREMIATLQLERDGIKSISAWPWQTGTITGLLSTVVLPIFVGFLISIFDKFLVF